MPDLARWPHTLQRSFSSRSPPLEHSVYSCSVRDFLIIIFPFFLLLSGPGCLFLILCCCGRPFSVPWAMAVSLRSNFQLSKQATQYAAGMGSRKESQYVTFIIIILYNNSTRCCRSTRIKFSIWCLSAVLPGSMDVYLACLKVCSIIHTRGKNSAKQVFPTLGCVTPHNLFVGRV